MSFFVYFIQSTNGSTYIGATVDLDKRIRQHNKELKGGATATSIKVQRGEVWSYVCYVENFPISVDTKEDLIRVEKIMSQNYEIN